MFVKHFLEFLELNGPDVLCAALGITGLKRSGLAVEFDLQVPDPHSSQDHPDHLFFDLANCHLSRIRSAPMLS